MALRETGPAYLILMGGLCALPPLSIDMGLPALTAVHRGLQTSPSMAGLTLSLFMAGFAATPLAYGMLSDRYGRRPLVAAGLALFALGGLACAFASTIGWLLAARVLQGAGAGAGPTIAFAATRDRLDGPTMARRLASLTMLLNTAPIIAPSLGALVLHQGGWRSVYGLLAATGIALLAAVLLGFRETLGPTAGPRTALLPDLIAALRSLASKRRTLVYGAIYGLGAGSMFAYVAGSPLILIGVLGVSTVTYAWFFAGTAIGIVLGALLSGRLAQRLSTNRILTAGLVLQVVSPLAAAGLVLADALTVFRLFPCMFVATVGYGLIAPASSHAALEPVPGMAGTAAALMNTVQMACMSLSSLTVALLFTSVGALAMPATMATIAGVAGLVLVGLVPEELTGEHGTERLA